MNSQEDDLNQQRSAKWPYWKAELVKQPIANTCSQQQLYNQRGRSVIASEHPFSELTLALLLKHNRWCSCLLLILSVPIYPWSCQVSEKVFAVCHFLSAHPAPWTWAAWEKTEMVQKYSLDKELPQEDTTASCESRYLMLKQRKTTKSGGAPCIELSVYSGWIFGKMSSQKGLSGTGTGCSRKW